MAHIHGDVGRSDYEYLNVDSSIIRAHPHAAGAKKDLKIRPLAVFAGELSTEIHTAVRGLGCPVRCALTAGQKGDAPQADALIEGLLPTSSWPIHSDRLRKAIADKGTVSVIPNNPSRAQKYPLDKHLYAQRSSDRMLFLRAQTVPKGSHTLREKPPETTAPSSQSQLSWIR